MMIDESDINIICYQFPMLVDKQWHFLREAVKTIVFIL